MLNTPIRTRFAPSPTGYLHVGGARTALFCWLFARHHHGQFILRIEDTDRERSTQEAIEIILRSMEWLDLDYDEGPFYQTQRLDRYQALLQQLLNEGKAYRCYCSKERLDQLRQQQQAHKEKPRYDGYCRDLGRQETRTPHVIRFRNPSVDTVSFQDQIHGLITVANSELDDLILARSDGTPTYNFTVVVDDLDMKITNVIRGTDHINNTPRQINLFKALGGNVPQYAHVPTIMGTDGKKLSKRHGALSVLQYRDNGYLSDALINYLSRLGWSHGDQEIFSREALIQYFTLSHVSRSPAAFDPEKLNWLNQHYLKTQDPQTLVKPFADQLAQLNIDYETGPPLKSIIKLQAERNKTLREMAEHSRYFFEPVQSYDEKAAKKHLTTQAALGLKALRDRFLQIEEKAWKKDLLHQVIVEVTETLTIKLGQLAQPLRVAVTGNTFSPPIDITLEYIGRKQVLLRISEALDSIGYS